VEGREVEGQIRRGVWVDTGGVDKERCAGYGGEV
jgi:hypothetical protein